MKENPTIPQRHIILQMSSCAKFNMPSLLPWHIISHLVNINGPSEITGKLLFIRLIMIILICSTIMSNFYQSVNIPRDDYHFISYSTDAMKVAHGILSYQLILTPSVFGNGKVILHYSGIYKLFETDL